MTPLIKGRAWSKNLIIDLLEILSKVPVLVLPPVSVYYVYENRKASARRNFDKIFSFDAVKEKSMKLVDIDQELYHATNMQGYPYFLIFDPNGKLVQHIHGYNDREMVVEKISKHIEAN